MLEKIISKKYNLLKPFLDEKSKRLFAAAEALRNDKNIVSSISVIDIGFVGYLRRWNYKAIPEMKT